MNNNSIFCEEDLVLAPPTELLDEAKKISLKTIHDEKFPFIIHYNPNQKNFMLSMLDAVCAIVEEDNEECHTISTWMNMTQLAFIKRSNCIERVKTDEGINPFIAEEAVNLSADTTAGGVVEETIIDSLEVQNELATPLSINATSEAITLDGSASSVAASTLSSCDSHPANTDMAHAQVIYANSTAEGCICCPGFEQWFKFTAPASKKYTICTVGDLDTVGTLYDCYGNRIVKVDDYEPCGKINFRIIRNFTAGYTYYIKVGANMGNVGSYTLYITDSVLANSVNINKGTITLEKGVRYELPITPKYTYKGYLGARPIPELSVTINPSNATEQKIEWWEQYNGVLECYSGWDDDGNRYFHVTAKKLGTAKLYAMDWKKHGKRDECTVTVLTPYEKMLQDCCNFSGEETALILKLYDKIETLFASESKLLKAWRCARLLSEFFYDYNTTILGISVNRWDDVAGSVTTEENIKTYFINTLGYTENQYNNLRTALLSNHNDTNNNHSIIDFAHMQYALAARLAYTLKKDGFASNLGTGLYTGNFGIYTDEEISYLGGWFGDAILTNAYGVGQTVLKNDDYMADLDAENIYRLIIQGKSAIDASNTYYSNMTSTNTRASIFLQYISYDTVKNKIFYELIDADLYMLLSNASNQGNIVLVNYYLDLINSEQYHFDEIKTRYPDTYNFLKSLENRLLTMGQYT